MDQRPTTVPADDNTTRAEYPPNSVTNKRARRSAVWSYFFPIVSLFVVIGALMLYWSNRPAHSEAPSTERSEVGTVGRTDGGFDPQPKPNNTQDEVENRGGDLAPVMSLADLRNGNTGTMTGRRVALDEVRLDRVSGRQAWVHDGDQTVAIVMPEGTPLLTAGERVAVTGRVERDDQGAPRIAADWIQVR